MHSSEQYSCVAGRSCSSVKYARSRTKFPFVELRHNSKYRPRSICDEVRKLSSRYRSALLLASAATIAVIPPGLSFASPIATRGLPMRRGANNLCRVFERLHNSLSGKTIDAMTSVTHSNNGHLRGRKPERLSNRMIQFCYSFRVIR